MAEALMDRDNLSSEMLRELFEDAYMEVEVDEDGDLTIRENFRVYVFPSADAGYIRFASFFKARPEAPREAKLRFVNAINENLVLARAYVTEAGGLAFEHYVCIDGGITPRSVVLTFKRFLAVLGGIGTYDTEDVLA